MEYSDIYLTAIRLINCQSWQDATIQFTEGLNIIVAENGVGKSVINKNIKAVVDPYSLSPKDRSDLIRYNASTCEAYYLFSDGSVYHISIGRKSSVYCYIEDINNPNEVVVGDAPPDDLLKKLGAVVKGGIVCNIIDMDQTRFLVDSDDNTNHSILSLLTNNESLDKLINSLETYNIPKTKTLYYESVTKKNVYETAMSKFSYRNIESLESNVANAEVILKNAEPLVEALECLQGITPFKKLPENISDSLVTINKLCKISNQLNLIHLTRKVDGSTVSLLNTSNRFNDILNKLEGITKVPDGLNNIQINLVVIQRLLTINRILSKIKNYEIDDSTQNLLSLVSKLISINSVIKSVVDKGDLQSMIDEIACEIDDIGGEEYDCPIHGKIRYIDGECIPSC